MIHHNRRNSKTDMHLMPIVFGIAIVFLSFCRWPPVILCEKAVFSSLAQLEFLWNKDILLVNTIQDIVNKLPEPPIALTR